MKWRVGIYRAVTGQASMKYRGDEIGDSGLGGIHDNFVKDLGQRRSLLYSENSGISREPWLCRCFWLQKASSMTYSLDCAHTSQTSKSTMSADGSRVLRNMHSELRGFLNAACRHAPYEIPDLKLQIGGVPTSIFDLRTGEKYIKVRDTLFPI